jgi:predicted DCC family thiol-disulfide oxidoreductase YuxK
MVQKLKPLLADKELKMQDNITNIAYPLTIYYDASCPLCRAEMHTIKETDFENKLILVDCSADEFAEPAFCPTDKASMMERIHAQDAAGQWIKGVDVFEIAYKAAGFNKLGQFWGSRTLRPILSRAYPFIADNRHWLSKTLLPYALNKLLRTIAKMKRV